jgi:hypothetical protein
MWKLKKKKRLPENRIKIMREWKRVGGKGKGKRK